MFFTRAAEPLPDIKNMKSDSSPEITERKSSMSDLLILILILFFQYSCCLEDYWGQFFCYPPGSKFHENNWKYIGNVKITSDKSGAFSQKSGKTVHITVTDRKRNRYLNDVIKFDCGGIDVSANWKNFDVLNIVLNEVGSEYVNDSYNRQLLKEGSRKLAELEYNFDYSLSRFVKKRKAGSVTEPP